ncbi:MAG: hypothetical protein II124_04655 [Clostridia bacterium]|nr:hypothetical protein [Clostridia bacterium]MBR6429167.1 hypothetical protein [Clostridia bacterium]
MQKQSVFTRYIIPLLLLLVGVGFVVYGVTDGEAGAVLRKAVAICMECIGIG